MNLNGDAVSMNGREENKLCPSLDIVYGDKLWPEMDKLNLKMLQKGSCTLFKALPIGLIPVHVDRKRYDELSRLQLDIIDILIYKISHDDSFLVQLLEPLSQTDQFISRLLAIHKKSLHSRVATTKPFLAVIRSDYFLDQVSGGWKQIEINTMSVAGGSFVDGIDTLFRNANSELSGFVAETRNETLKANRAQIIIDGIQDVHNLYLRKHHSSVVERKATGWTLDELVFENTGDPDRGCFSAPLEEEDANNNAVGLLGDQSVVDMALPAVLVIVKNYCEPFYKDQRNIINGLAARNIPVLVSTLADISVSQYKRSVLDKLVIRARDGTSTFQISTVYFRGGYDPKDYVNVECWNFVECAELSAAVLCPNVGLHLAGTKRVQCALSEQMGQQFMDRHFPNNPSRDLLFSTFAKQFELNESNVDQVLKDPFSYVVKPQREGGTNNLFGNDIVSFLSKLENKCELKRYIAMELIQSATWPDFPVRSGDGHVQRVEAAVAEVGAMSLLVTQAASPDHPDTLTPQVIRHECAAPLTKIKRSGSDEAGVSAGHGFLASVTTC